MSDIKIPIHLLQPGDLFTFTSTKGYLLSTISKVGLGLYQITYRHLRQDRRYVSIKRGSDLVKVAPIGRYYNYHQEN